MSSDGDPHMRCTRVGDVVVVGHIRGEAEPDTFNAVIQRLLEPQVQKLIIVAYRGATVNAAQRAEFIKIARNKLRKVAVVVDSPIGRGAAIALGWFFEPLATFAPDSMDDAIEHLALNGEEQRALKSELGRIMAELGMT